MTCGIEKKNREIYKKFHKLKIKKNYFYRNFHSLFLLLDKIL